MDEELDADINLLNTRKLKGNALVQGIVLALEHIAELKLQTCDFYYRVILSLYACPKCGGRLHMSGPSRCACNCGLVLDPTLEFQRCPVCQGKLVLKYFHYACQGCQRVVPSRFLFEERVFNAEYFRERMERSRERQRQRIEDLRCWLATTRSETLALPSDPSLDSVPGLASALDEFIGTVGLVSLSDFMIFDTFRMEDYRSVILAGLDECRLFSTITPVGPDRRRDRARRFTTLVFMEQEREVDLIQHGNDLWVMRHEADSQGC